MFFSLLVSLTIFGLSATVYAEDASKAKNPYYSKGADSLVVKDGQVCDGKKCYCKVYDDMAYDSKTIRTIQQTCRTACCSLCGTTGNCGCWTWTEDEGCELKARCKDCKKEDEVGAEAGKVIKQRKRYLWTQKGLKTSGGCDIGKLSHEKNILKCAERCEETDGCGSFNWKPKKRGSTTCWGKCYLKKAGGDERKKDKRYMVGYPSLARLDECNVKKGIQWKNEEDLGSVYGVTPSECCMMCHEWKYCTAWTWFPGYDGTCVLKQTAGAPVPCKDAISGWLPTNCDGHTCDTYLTQDEVEGGDGCDAGNSDNGGCDDGGCDGNDDDNESDGCDGGDCGEDTEDESDSDCGGDSGDCPDSDSNNDSDGDGDSGDGGGNDNGDGYYADESDEQSDEDGDGDSDEDGIDVIKHKH